jgi:putative ABC transport system ATP-binding protein
LSLLSLENITKSYDKKSIVLNEFNLSVNTGEMVAIMGKSGSGKSTVLNIISGIESADSGRYIFKGNDMSKVSGDKMTVFRRENIGFVLQHFALIENNSVFKNIALPLYLKHESKNVIKGKVLELAKDLEIENKLDKKPKQLSGGEAQRVAIARAIINQPSLILADEPTGALDENTGLKIMQIFRKLHQKGHTFIIVTHDSSVAEMCDRTIKIKDGKNV